MAPPLVPNPVPPPKPAPLVVFGLLPNGVVVLPPPNRPPPVFVFVLPKPVDGVALLFPNRPPLVFEPKPVEALALFEPKPVPPLPKPPVPVFAAFPKRPPLDDVLLLDPPNKEFVVPGALLLLFDPKPVEVMS